MNKKKIIIGIIIITVIIIIIIVLGVVVLHQMNNNEPVLQEDIENIGYEMVYETDSMILVRDYNVFYNLEKVVKSFVNDLNNENYEKILLNIGSLYINNVGKDQVLKKLETFSAIIKEIPYENLEHSKLLYQVYQKEENIYNCLINVNSSIYYILIYLDYEDKSIEINNIVLAEEI